MRSVNTDSFQKVITAQIMKVFFDRILGFLLGFQPGLYLLYLLSNIRTGFHIIAVRSQFVDKTLNFMANDSDLAMDIFANEINFLQSSWRNQLGRPLVVVTQDDEAGTHFSPSTLTALL